MKKVMRWQELNPGPPSHEQTVISTKPSRPKISDVDQIAGIIEEENQPARRSVPSSWT